MAKSWLIYLTGAKTSQTEAKETKFQHKNIQKQLAHGSRHLAGY